MNRKVIEIFFLFTPAPHIHSQEKKTYERIFSPHPTFS